MKIIILILCLIFAYCLWRFVVQNSSQTLQNSKKFDLSRLFKVSEVEQPKVEPIIEVVNLADIKLFDDVSKLLFEKAIQKQDLAFAAQIQAEFLNKMPTQTQTQINQFDLGEWSIFWAYKNQSLEYYASKYGIFYTHVDAEGVEHKIDFKIVV